MGPDGARDVMVEVNDLISVILDSTPQPVWVVGPDGAVLYTNPAALRVLGYTARNAGATRPRRRRPRPSCPPVRAAARCPRGSTPDPRLPERAWQQPMGHQRTV
ncbi:PAS domain-containing protein [Pseudonocardia spinosispora]|uniref:PAS domain-containing protein n=1 Tax=Pseudonocardia spinosispora TaxID=103441 RepID=UPI0012EBFC08